MDDVLRKLDILIQDNNWDDEVSIIVDRFSKEELSYDEMKEINSIIDSKLHSLGLSSSVS